jgi:hypothetical protein
VAISRLFRAIWHVNPIWGTVASLVCGIVVVVASVPLGIAFVTYDVGGGLQKQVGFIPSLNWSVVLVVLFPAAIFTALRTVRLFTRAFLDLPRRRMLAGRDWSPASDEQARALLSKVWSAATPIGAIFFIVAVAIGLWDFLSVVWAPISDGHLLVAPGKSDFEQEIDWSVSSLLGGLTNDPLPNRTANLVFDAIAYLVLTLEMGLILSFYGFLVGLSAVLYGLSEGDAQPFRLVPDASDPDRRRGFEHFERFFLGVLSVTLLGYLACYLMRIQNLFLRDKSYLRLDQMIFNQLSSQLSSDWELPHDVQSAVDFVARNVTDIAHAVFATGDLADTQSYLGVVLLLTVMLVVALSLFAVLRGAAHEGRHVVERELGQPVQKTAIAQFYGMPAEAIKTNIGATSMEVWPLKWPTLNGVIAYLSLGAACFFFYRLAILWIALQIWYLITRLPKE